MADTTIGAIILDGDGKSFIGENTAKKEALITPMPLYLLDSDQTDVFDFGGTIKTFNLAGVFVGTSKAVCKTFIDSCEALIQGHQDVEAGYPITFTDDYRGTKKIKIFDFESSKIQGEPLIVRWSFKFVESSTNA